MKIFKAKVSRLFQALYGGLITLFLVIALYIFLTEQVILLPIIFLVIALSLAILLYSGYQIRYELTDQKLKARWLFGTKNIELGKINAFKPYKLPYTTIRRLGISLMGGRYSHGEIGKFYAIFTSREGVIIEADEASIYGGNLFISPKKPKKFLKELEEKIIENKTAE